MGRRRLVTAPRTLAPHFWDRVVAVWRAGGWNRVALIRRGAAGLLVVLAAVLAVAPGQRGDAQTSVVVASRDLAPGTVLEPAQLTVRDVPSATVPDGARHSLADLRGRLLAAPVRSGEVITDVRLTGPELTRLVAGDPAAVSVPVRLADPGVAALLHPGSEVDVVTLGPDDQGPRVLARAARVAAVLPESEDDGAARGGRLVLVTLDENAATQVAAALLSQEVTVTVR